MKSWTFFVSQRLLFSRHSSGWMRTISLISVLGVAVGVMALITVISVMNGFEVHLRDRILGMDAHLVVESSEAIRDYPTVLSKLMTIDGVLGASPYVRGQGLIRAANRVSGVVVHGINPAFERNVSELENYIESGELGFNDHAGNPEIGIVLGRELARVLAVGIGDQVELISPVFKDGSSGAPVPIMQSFLVTGTFSSGMYEYDSSFAYVSMTAAQKFFGAGDVATGMSVKINTPLRPRGVKKAVALAFPRPFWVKDWTDMNENLFSAMKMEKTVMFLILTLIVIVAALNITSALLMSVMEKTGDIGILKAIGATEKDISTIFAVKGFSIGLLGVCAGAAGGWMLCAYLKTHPFIHLPSDIYYIDVLPVELKAIDIAGIMIAALIVSLLSAVIPARHASRMNVVEALRHE